MSNTNAQSEAAEMVLSVVANGRASLAVIARKLSDFLSRSEISAALDELEMAGEVRMVGLGTWEVANG